MTSFPLHWPAGWKRTKHRSRALFSSNHDRLTIAQGRDRLLDELRQLGVIEESVIISSNLRTKRDGFPYSNQGEPNDPGVAVYWKKGKDAQHKVIATDQYDRVADNLGALAATLRAMRAIERHGGAVILERVFSGFLALPAPNTWRAVLGYPEDGEPTIGHVVDVFRLLSKGAHPDMVGGSDAQMKELNWAMAEAKKELEA